MTHKVKSIIMLAIFMIAGTMDAAAAGDNTVVNCCIQGGQNVTVNGCSCTVIAGSGSKGRARGDVVQFDVAGKKAQMLKASGEIQVPAIGNFGYYQVGFTPTTAQARSQFGSLPAGQRVIRLIIASFSLKDFSKNPAGLSPALQRIIQTAAQKYPWAESMVWVGRALPGETSYTEVTETYSDLADVSQSAPLTYKTYPQGMIDVTLPAAKDAKGNKVPQEQIQIDLAPINKQ